MKGTPFVAFEKEVFGDPNTDPHKVFWKTRETARKQPQKTEAERGSSLVENGKTVSRCLYIYIWNLPGIFIGDV